MTLTCCFSNSASKLTQQESILFFLDTKVAVSADFAGKADNQSSSNSPQMLFDVTPFKTIGEVSIQKCMMSKVF